MTWTEKQSTLTCDTSGVDHLLRVATPFRYESLTAAPLILCLDGAWTHGAVTDATRIMSMSDEAPEAIVAGLSFTDESMADYLRSRARWFCPTQWVPPEIVGVKDVVAGDMGHALTYLAFLKNQVMPALLADYRVSETWLVGHSFSGLFGLRTLFAEPSLFDKYLLASPSIWWDDRVMLDLEAEYAASHQDLPAQVFLAAGEQETGPDSEFDIGGNMVEMATRLTDRNYPSLTVDHVVLSNESHSSTIGAAISRGLRSLR